LLVVDFDLDGELLEVIAVASASLVENGCRLLDELALVEGEFHALLFELK
jgi:hypothetical protein